MALVVLDPSNPDALSVALDAAGEEIRQGHLVAFPTETVYGLGADATNGLAMAQIYQTKGRPRINPLIVHLPDTDSARNHVVFTDQAEQLATAFWPGSLTMVLPRRADSSIHDLASAGLSTLALRVPSHPIARGLILAARTPIAAPSANKSGEPSPTTALHVAESLGAEGFTILDAGPCHAGLESTVIGFDRGRCIMLRLGAISREDIEAVVGRLVDANEDESRPSSPGQLLRHYAPRAQLRLNAESAEPGELYLAFGPNQDVAGGLQLSASADLREAAANLFAMLREADRLGASALAVAPIPETGLGEAINDRLRRAASAQQ